MHHDMGWYLLSIFVVNAPLCKLRCCGRCPSQTCEAWALIWYHISTNLPSLRASSTAPRAWCCTLDSDQNWWDVAVYPCETGTPLAKQHGQMRKFCTQNVYKNMHLKTDPTFCSKAFELRANWEMTSGWISLCWAKKNPTLSDGEKSNGMKN